MAKSKVRIPSPGFFLQISVACFFLVLGICGIFPNVNESIFSLVKSGPNLVIEVIFGVLELICGLILLAGLFTFVFKKWMSLASLAIFIFWLITIIYTQFFNQLLISNTGIALLPDIMQWILNLMLELVVLASIWLINRHFSE